MQPAIKEMQKTLNSLGFPCGTPDGWGGPQTESGLQSFFDDAGLRFAVTATSDKISVTGPFSDAAPLDGKLPWMVMAEEKLGLHEDRDNAALRRFLSNGKYLGDPSALPWCGDFVESISKLVLPNEALPGALGENPFWARNWLLFGVAIQPCFGAIVVFERGSGGHVGYLVGQDATHYYVLGGNQSDGVTIARIEKRRALGTRWPNTHIRPASEYLPQMKPGTTKISYNEA